MKIVYKPPGVTINQFINTFKKENNVTKVCYCGRLDPMARGKILLLENDECMIMDTMNKKSKTYCFEIVFGFSTKSDDALGYVDTIEDVNIDIITKCKIAIMNHVDTFDQKFHLYSSKRIDGKPLWYYAKNNINIEQPTHNVTIYEKNIGILKEYSFNDWRTNIINIIKTIDNNCDFNQSEIIKRWEDININTIYSLPITLTVSSGFYIRQFVRDIQNEINFPLLTYDINRTELFL